MVLIYFGVCFINLYSKERNSREKEFSKIMNIFRNKYKFMFIKFLRNIKFMLYIKFNYKVLF